MAANKRVGEVEFTVGERTYIARFGNRELSALEEQWNVLGLGRIFVEGMRTGNKRFVEFARAGLSRHQPELTFDDVADLLDYTEENGDAPAVLGIVAAFEQVTPKAKTPTAKTTEPAAQTTETEETPA